MPIGSRGEFDFGQPGAEPTGVANLASPVNLANPADAALAHADRKARRQKRRHAGGGGGDGGPMREPVPEAPRGSSALLREDASVLRRKRLVVGAILVALAATSCCITMSTPMWVSPVEVVQCYAFRIQQLVMGVVDANAAPRGSDFMVDHPMYPWVITNFEFTVVYVLAGFMLALSGALYQNVFKNPIASPSMLGVSSGIQLGVALMICLFGTAAGAMFLERYLFCYIAVVVILALLFGFTALMGGGGRSRNVTNMLLVGVLLNQFIGVIVTYLTWFVFDDELLDIFTSLTSMVTPATDAISWAFLLVGFVLAVVPVVLLRFRLNSLSFSAYEMKLFGVDAPKLQAVALVCGTIGMVTAQLQVGAVAMITLVVPHISRAIFGAEFRKQFAGTMLLGAAVLLCCRIVAMAIPYTGEIPIGVVVNFVLMPAFVWMIATQQSRWD